MPRNNKLFNTLALICITFFVLNLSARPFSEGAETESLDPIDTQLVFKVKTLVSASLPHPDRPGDWLIELVYQLGDEVAGFISVVCTSNATDSLPNTYDDCAVVESADTVTMNLLPQRYYEQPNNMKTWLSEIRVLDVKID